MNEGGSLIKFKGLKLDLLSSTKWEQLASQPENEPKKEHERKCSGSKQAKLNKTKIKNLLNMASLMDHCLALLTSYAEQTSWGR